MVIFNAYENRIAALIIQLINKWIKWLGIDSKCK